MIEVIQLNPFSPTSYCWRCRVLMKPGEQVESISVPINFRYGKQRKKAKAYTVHVHLRHVKCAENL